MLAALAAIIFAIKPSKRRFKWLVIAFIITALIEIMPIIAVYWANQG